MSGEDAFPSTLSLNAWTGAKLPPRRELTVCLDPQFTSKNRPLPDVDRIIRKSSDLWNPTPLDSSVSRHRRPPMHGYISGNVARSSS
jgi:hypothetical protein